MGSRLHHFWLWQSIGGKRPGVRQHVIERGRAVDVRRLKLLVGSVRLQSLQSEVHQHLDDVALAFFPCSHGLADAYDDAIIRL